MEQFLKVEAPVVEVWCSLKFVLNVMYLIYDTISYVFVILAFSCCHPCLYTGNYLSKDQLLHQQNLIVVVVFVEEFFFSGFNTPFYNNNYC